MPQLVMDFVNLSMHTSLALDKVVPPRMNIVQNAELAEWGKFRKRAGYDDFSTNVSPSPSGTQVNAVAPVLMAVSGVASVPTVAVVDDEIWYLILRAGTWTQLGTTYAGLDTYPLHLSWGLNSSNEASLYLANRGPGVYRVELTGAVSATLLGGATFSVAAAAEFFLNKLFVGNTTESAVVYGDRLRWSATGNDTTWTGSGTGAFDLTYRGSIGLSSSGVGISALRQYRNRLWIGTWASLHVLTGTTSTTFGAEYIRPQNVVNGATMYEVGGYLWYVDRDGIWQFDGSTALNVAQQDMRERWETLSDANDIDKATASWDQEYGIYRVYFPTVKELWNYHYRTQQWGIWTFAGANSIRVIGPPINASFQPTPFLLGALTGGKVLYSGNTSRDDGSAITGSFTTGDIHLGSLAQQPTARASIRNIWVYAARQTAATTLTMDLTINGTALTQQNLSIDSNGGGSADIYPTRFRMTLPDMSVADPEYFRFKFQDATDNVRGDLRKIVIEYDVKDAR